MSPNPVNLKGLGAMDVTKSYEFIRLGAMDVTKTYEFIKFGAAQTPKIDDFRPAQKPCIKTYKCRLN